MRPMLIFLDEPTSGLDAFATHVIMKKVGRPRAPRRLQPGLGLGLAPTLTLTLTRSRASRAAAAATRVRVRARPNPNPNPHQVAGLAHSGGCNVLTTIHQPSSEVFHSFDKVMLPRLTLSLTRSLTRSLTLSLSLTPTPTPSRSRSRSRSRPLAR